MSTQEIAKAFTELCRAGKFEEAGEKFWSDDIVSVEPMPGDMHRLEGRKAVKAKGDWWAANHEVHGCKVEGPYSNGDQFTLGFELDVTPKGQPRMTMREHGLFTIKDGKIVEERFFFGGALARRRGLTRPFRTLRAFAPASSRGGISLASRRAEWA